MHLYKFFHPHHNPSLYKTPLRLQELAELHQATIELRNAAKRARSRAEHAPVEPIHAEHFDELLSAADYLAECFNTLVEAHPGDDSGVVAQLINERRASPGWERWADIAEETLARDGAMDETRDGTSKGETRHAR